jgi:hypothetical protein
MRTGNFYLKQIITRVFSEGSFEAVSMKITIFWGLTPYGLVDRYRSFEDARCFHFKGR